jgi:Cu+-exporting ATPase
MVSIIDMKNAIEDVGYQYLGIEDITSTKQEEELEEDDLKTWKKRMIVAFGFGIPLGICTFITWSLPISFSFFSLLISIIPFIYVSYPIFSAGIRSLKNKHLNMDIMYSMGIGVAYGSSILGTFSIVLNQQFLFYDTALLLADSLHWEDI